MPDNKNTRKSSVRIRKTLHLVTRSRPADEWGNAALQRGQGDDRQAIARPGEDEIRMQAEAVEWARQEAVLAERFAEGRDEDAFSDKSDQIVER